MAQKSNTVFATQQRASCRLTTPFFAKCNAIGAKELIRMLKNNSVYINTKFVLGALGIIMWL